MMALAILMILCYHTKGAWPETALKKAAGFFYGGVDIFFFTSGIGCFFSCSRDRDPVGFLRRRAGRILPVYLPFILVWILIQARDGGIGFTAALANLFGVQGFTAVSPSFNWYVSGMWLSYLLTPWLAPLAESCGTRLKAAAAVLALLLFSAAFWGDNELIISGRRKALTKAELALLLGLMPVGAAIIWESPRFFPDLIWSHGIAWYPMLLIAPGLCILTAAVSAWLEGWKPGRAINRALGFLGGLTFEIYLTHFWALEKPLPLFLLLTAVYTALLVGVSRLLRKRLQLK